MKIKNNLTVPSKSILTVCAFAVIAATSGQAAVLATYTLNDTDKRVATGVLAGVTAGDFVIQGQTEDTTPATLANDQYGFLSTGMVINRPSTSTYWLPPANTLDAPFKFTVTAGATQTVTIQSITMTASSSSGANTAVYFGFGNTAETDYGTIIGFAPAESTSTANLPSDYVIAPGDSRTFYIDVNSSNGDSTHQFSNFKINGTVVPEPSTFAIAALAGIALLHRRRQG